MSSISHYNQERRAHWDALARKMDAWNSQGGYYRKLLRREYRFLIPPGQSILEIGCAQGDLLAALNPSRGVGVDFSGEMIARARQKYPQLEFVEADAHTFTAEGTFDAIILSDVVNDLWDVQKMLENLRPLCSPRTRIVINTYSRMWELPLAVARRLNLASPNLTQNWFTVADLKNLLALVDYDVIRSWTSILLPVRIPVIAPLLNRFFARVWPTSQLALTNFILARPTGLDFADGSTPPGVSVIVPARNERGNIADIIETMPRMGRGAEIVFVEGGSSDGTYEEIERQIARHPDAQCSLHRQTGKGKGDAVRLGFAKAAHEVLMIYDADRTVPEDDLPRFYHALVSGKGEFINGVRLVYPMEKEAMRFFNLIGNKFFSLTFSWLLGQPVKDTLCGTKALWKQDYEDLVANRAYFGDFDPFGDFDLLFGAAKLGLKIVDLPVRYRERTYGDTNIQRWAHGWLLLRMVLFAAARIKFR